MKGVRFYLEFDSLPNRRNGHHTGNVFAAFTCNGRNNLGGYDGVGSVHDWPNSPVAKTGCSSEYLKTTKRISEQKARSIHPALFSHLG